jgi:hypothetical protein
MMLQRSGFVVALALCSTACGDESRGGDVANGSGLALGSTGTEGAGKGEGGATGDDDPIRFDVGEADTDALGCTDMPGGGGGEGNLELSYIWVANSAEGTISKIDTQTMVEEGRYQAKPAGGDPSRTSVNLQGDVAVANRNGGVAKFWANPEDCVDRNGQPGIQTSGGGADIMPWGQDDCLAWYTELTCSSNRPAAWTAGEWNAGTCAYEGGNLWTVCDSNAHLLDGETGAIVQTVALDPSAFVYGGAADSDGNFWGLDTGTSNLLRIGIDDFILQSWPLPPPRGYGITVGPEGRPWVCGGGGVSRFNVDTATWDSSAGAASGISGCMTDGESVIWHSEYGTGRLLGYDIDSLLLVEEILLPEYVHGVSVDFQGMVWGVSFSGPNAYRADPATDVVDTFTGLVGAYTYSDMTGFALSSAGVTPPAG